MYIIFCSCTKNG